MRVLIVNSSYVYKKYSLGGSQFHIMQLAEGLVSRDYKVQLYTLSVSKPLPFELHELYRQNYINHDGDLNVSFIFDQLNELYAAANHADIVISTDKALPVKLPKPVVHIQTSICSEPEFLSVFSDNWDYLVTMSQYANDCLQFLSYRSGLIRYKKLVAIPNGVDTNKFKPVNTKQIRSLLKLSKNDIPLLFPHRPEENKGFQVSLDLLGRLVSANRHFKLLVPVNREFEDDKLFYKRIKKTAKDAGTASNVIFHDWIETALMPAYFSLGLCTLALGTSPETFGYSAAQSIACGTPVIASICGNMRHIAPKGSGIFNFYPGSDIDDVAKIIIQLSEKQVAQSELTGRDYIKEHYELDGMLDKYIAVLKHAVQGKKKELDQQSPANRISECPWLFSCGDKVWDDLSQNYVQQVNKDEKQGYDNNSYLEQGVAQGLLREH